MKKKYFNGAAVQTEGIVSFIGGKPYLPRDMVLPICGNCQSEQTFFFQVECDEISGWEDYVLSLFCCTSCQNDTYLIPEMLDGDLKQATPSQKFLENYQVNFSVNIWNRETLSLRQDYIERVAFIPLAEKGATEFGHMGKAARWVLGNETPAEIVGETPVFLFGVKQDFEFPIVDTAKGQIEFDFMTGGLAETGRRTYRLFLSNALYFFGMPSKQNLIYILTQCD